MSDDLVMAVAVPLLAAHDAFDERIRYNQMTDEQRVWYDVQQAVKQMTAALVTAYGAIADTCESIAEYVRAAFTPSLFDLGDFRAL